MSIGKDRQGAAQPKGQWIRTAKRLAIYIRDGFQCLYCGTDLRSSDPANITLDHLIPRSRGGDNGAENLVTACRPCNSSRQDTPWTTFATGGARVRITATTVRPLNLELAQALIAGTIDAATASLEARR